MRACQRALTIIPNREEYTSLYPLIACAILMSVQSSGPRQVGLRYVSVIAIR